MGCKTGQNKEWGTQRPDGKTRSREQQEKNCHHEQPKAGENGVHSDNIRQNDVSRISSPSDKTLALSLVPPEGRCSRGIT